MSSPTPVPAQLSADQPTERIWLDETTWVDLVRGFVPDAAEVYDALAERVEWRRRSNFRYDHTVAENYQYGAVSPAFHPALLMTHKALRRTYRCEFEGPTLVLYQHGGEAMGAHRDTDMRWCTDTRIAILSLGATRPFLLRHKASRRDAPAALDLAPASGDLLVMGGRAQADWLHGVPQARAVRTPRISVQWRWTSRTGPPERGAGYAAPRRFGR